MMSAKTILVVDDSDFDRKLLRESLKRKGGYEVLEAANGEQCLNLIESQKVDLLLLDILMPGETGIEILGKIRAKHNAIELPVIMLTMKSDTTHVADCLNLGANDYLTKPADLVVTIARISTHLRLSELSRQMVDLKEREALSALIVTYNHEINNPLTVVQGCLRKGDLNDPSNRKKLEDAFERIADVNKRIRTITEFNTIEYVDYSKDTKMVAVRSKK